MPAKNKTAQTRASVADFIESFVDQDWKKQESYRLTALMQEWSGFEPRMWGPSIIGFGSYHYIYDSGHEGDAPVLGFSPRKNAFSLYVFSPTDLSRELLTRLGKYKMGKACIYVKRLDDIEMPVLRELCAEAIRHTRKHYPVTA